MLPISQCLHHAWKAQHQNIPPNPHMARSLAGVSACSSANVFGAVPLYVCWRYGSVESSWNTLFGFSKIQIRTIVTTNALKNLEYVRCWGCYSGKQSHVGILSYCLKPHEAENARPVLLFPVYIGTNNANFQIEFNIGLKVAWLSEPKSAVHSSSFWHGWIQSGLFMQIKIWCLCSITGKAWNISCSWAYA